MILDPESELESDFLSLFTPNSGRLISFGITGADFMGGIGSTGGFDTTTAADLCEIYVNVTQIGMEPMARERPEGVGVVGKAVCPCTVCLLPSQGTSFKFADLAPHSTKLMCAHLQREAE